MCGYFCIGFIDFILKEKMFIRVYKFISPNEYKNNDKII